MLINKENHSKKKKWNSSVPPISAEKIKSGIEKSCNKLKNATSQSKTSKLKLENLK